MQMSCCPVPPNTDPKRLFAYCPPVVSRSEPLSHSEYLRKKKANQNAGISSGSLLQTGEGSYTRTIWTATEGPCCVIPPVPAAISGTPQESMRIKEVGATASRGAISHYDSVNHTEWNTTQRRAGYAIASDKYECDTCDLVGTTPPTVPGLCNCK